MSVHLRIGIDLDNTLAHYDIVFQKLVRQRGLKLDAAALANKKNIRDAVRAAAGNDVWTELQGLAYGPGMKDAALMPGAERFLEWARGAGAALFVVSHKTRRSAVGGHDLHTPASAWLEARGLKSDAFLEETREAKFARIAGLNLTHFIDDLEEFLTDPAFPAGPVRLHYAPEGGAGAKGLRSFKSWDEILEFFKKS